MPIGPKVVQRGLKKLRLRTPAGRASKKTEDAAARAIQTRLLPQKTPQLPGFEIASAWQSSAQVSGDYFDIFPLAGDTFALCIADVSGKGKAAVSLMQELHDAVRKFASAVASPAELCTRVNQALSRPGQTRYVTMFYGVLDAATKRLCYESAGHCLPLLVRDDGSVQFLTSFSGLIGLFSHWLYQSQEVELRSGDCLLLLTDGVLQAENHRHEGFGYRRLIAAVETGSARGADALAQEILAKVTRFTGDQLEDDASLIVVRVL
ncbi:MAG TPA: PP2C family protein-serine/threonine phosphatase [Acidobacteriaceae bacterium]|nr:PP2C family protein-serine/threonine phosphatase [Acidobacteriaceae bacterium]